MVDCLIGSVAMSAEEETVRVLAAAECSRPVAREIAAASTLVRLTDDLAGRAAAVEHPASSGRLALRSDKEVN